MAFNPREFVLSHLQPSHLLILSVKSNLATSKLILSPLSPAVGLTHLESCLVRTGLCGYFEHEDRPGGSVATVGQERGS